MVFYCIIKPYQLILHWLEEGVIMYDQFASDYDRFVNWDNRLGFEIPLIEKILCEVNNPLGEPLTILDAACGTGMHALALTRAGYQVAGADFSTEMIKKAELNALSVNLELPLKAVGFGSLASAFGESRFDAVLCLGNSLPHLIDENELLAALNDFFACLKQGGLLLIQNRNFDAVMHKKDRWLEPQAFQEGDAQWVFERFYDFNSDGTIGFSIVNLHRNKLSKWKSTVVSTLLKPQLRDDLYQKVARAGFSHTRTFGTLGGDPFDPLSSGNLILVARK
ncbi:class I SAM-dependent methyltransferase [bacterium]|nr:class I SAM-dependent methyltransferase [bacterium]